MPCLVSILATCWRTGDQPNKDLGALFRGMADMIPNITNREIPRPGMLVARRIGQVGIVGCTNDWHNSRSSRKLILRITPPIACAHLAVYSCDFPSLQGAPVQNRGVPEMGDVLKGTVYI